MWEFQYNLLYHATAGTVLPLQICCLHMATPVHQEKKWQVSWFRGEKLEQRLRRSNNKAPTTTTTTKKCEHNCNNILCNYHCKWEKRWLAVEFSCLHCEPALAALYTIAIANHAMDDPWSKSRETEGKAQVGREGISYHIKRGEDSIGFQYWFLCNIDTNVRLQSYIATCKLSYRRFPRWSISSSSL